MHLKAFKQFVFILFLILFEVACVDKHPSSNEKLDTQELTKNQTEVHGTEIKPGEIF